MKMAVLHLETEFLITMQAWCVQCGTIFGLKKKKKYLNYR